MLILVDFYKSIVLFYLLIGMFINIIDFEVKVKEKIRENRLVI